MRRAGRLMNNSPTGWVRWPADSICLVLICLNSSLGRISGFPYMKEYAAPLARLVEELKCLPGIGQKSAQRIAFHLERAPREDVQRLAEALLDAKDKIRLCSLCNNLTESDPCEFCSDPTRDQSVVCVVETPYNIVGIERTREFHGLYHVLH